MTAPVDVSAVPGIAAVTARIQAIQTQLASLAPGALGRTGSATSASQFAATLASATTPAASTAASVSTTGGVSGQTVVDTAKKYLGVPYVWGGESDSGLDCSGLVQKTFGDLGIKLPRTAAQQQDVGTAVPSLAQAQPGDLVFFGDPAYHVAIYAGDNKIVESPEPGKVVHVTELRHTPTSIRRMDGVGATATTVAVDGATIPSGVNARVASYAADFAAVEQQRGLPHGLLAAVAQQESGGNANAISPAGARGLMQLMPATAAGMGVDPLDPHQAIKAAGRILQRNLHEFGTVPLALAAYNAGAGAVHRYGGIPPYDETQNYVRRITATLAGAR